MHFSFGKFPSIVLWNMSFPRKCPFLGDVLWKFPCKGTTCPFVGSSSGNFLTLKISPSRLSSFNICILHRLFLSICSLECEGETVLQVGVFSVWLSHSTKIELTSRDIRRLFRRLVSLFELQIIRTHQDSKISRKDWHMTPHSFSSCIGCGGEGCQKLRQCFIKNSVSLPHKKKSKQAKKKNHKDRNPQQSPLLLDLSLNLDLFSFPSCSKQLFPHFAITVVLLTAFAAGIALLDHGLQLMTLIDGGQHIISCSCGYSFTCYRVLFITSLEKLVMSHLI